METFKAMSIGVIFGIITSTIFSFVFVFIGQVAAGGVTGLVGEYWLYIATLAPFTLGFAILGYIFSKNITFNKKIGWVYSCIIAFIVTFYVSTIGALIGEHIVSDDNFSFYEGFVIHTTTPGDNLFYWGFIYAIVLLPLTTIIARYLIKLFELILNSIRGQSRKVS